MVDEITGWHGAIDGRPVDFRIVSGGFGRPHLIASYKNIEIALIECDGGDYDGPQDGNDPLQAYGWKWRRADHGNHLLLGDGWSDEYDTATEALRAAIVAISD